MASKSDFPYRLKTGLDIAITRRRLRVYQPEIAMATGISVTFQSLIENGHVLPTPEQLAKIRAYFEQRYRATADDTKPARSRTASR